MYVIPILLKKPYSQRNGQSSKRVANNFGLFSSCSAVLRTSLNFCKKYDEWSLWTFVHCKQFQMSVFYFIFGVVLFFIHDLGFANDIEYHQNSPNNFNISQNLISRLFLRPLKSSKIISFMQQKNSSKFMSGFLKIWCYNT